MMRILFILLLLLIAGFLFLESSLRQRSGTKPVFLQIDEIASTHHTKISTKVRSLHKPDCVQLEQLKKDYSNIWAHLNHLYATNEVEAGKEYYSEDWFKQLVNHYEGGQPVPVRRQDERHELHIQNWASDGLVCAAIDSNVVLRYTYPDLSERVTAANLAVVLFFQGDHWRIDALRVLSEAPH